MIPCTDSGSGSSPSRSCHPPPSRYEQAAVDEHADELLGVQRVPLGARRERLAATPPATCAARADRPRASPSRIVRSGASAIVAAFARAPQVGRRSRSSGPRRADQHERRIVAQSARWSRKSSRPSSAQWRSSTTSTSGPHSASASNKRRQAANASSRRLGRARDASSATSGRRWLSTHAASLGSATRSRTARRSFCSAVAGVVRLEDPGLGLDHLAERPERDALAVREAAATAPGHEARLVATARAGAPRRVGSCRSRERRSGSRAERCGRVARERACRGSGSAPPCGRRAARAARLSCDAPSSAARAKRLVDRDRVRPSRAPGAAGARRTRSRPGWRGTSTRRRAPCRRRLPPRSGTSS